MAGEAKHATSSEASSGSWILPVSVPLSVMASFFIGGPGVLVPGLILISMLSLLSRRPASALMMLGAAAMLSLVMDWTVPFKFGMVAPALSIPLLLAVAILNSTQVSRIAAGAVTTLGCMLALVVLCATEMRHVI